MKTAELITINPEVMGGKPCIAGTRVTTGTIKGLVSTGSTVDEIAKMYPYVTVEGIEAALEYSE